MNKRYLPPTAGGAWAISRHIGGRWIALIENRALCDCNDAKTVLFALGIQSTQHNLDWYFPISRKYGRCPTLDLLELFSELGNKNGSQIGV